MLLALMADTHDNEGDTVGALGILRGYGVGAYLHAGDLISPGMLEHFAGLTLHFVFGNNEFDHAALRAKAGAMGFSCHDHVGRLTFGGKRVALLHGHDQVMLRKVLEEAGGFDYVVTGHTHVKADEKRGGTRFINPGALYRVKTKTVALLDVGADTVRFLEVPAAGGKS